MRLLGGRLRGAPPRRQDLRPGRRRDQPIGGAGQPMGGGIGSRGRRGGVPSLRTLGT
ncbi:hypothetical protein ACFSM7_09545 [Clavibacter michiganensis subsp. tessellarius]|uniref:hypothetical protein n=1 Tax=Clavibacter tessellarius TaxID=31965 RepID=UPI00362C5FB9